MPTIPFFGSKSRLRSSPQAPPLNFSSEQHINSLDGWRGVAILLVFTFHYAPVTLRNPLELVASLGWSGVDLFFVLSGFLITGILYDSRNERGYFKVFYARRALRLLPVYCLAVAVVAVGTDFFSGSRSWLDIPFFIYGSNIVLAITNANPNFLPHFDCFHFWSLAVEEQFYSIWPLVVFFFPRRRTLVTICIAGMTIAFGMRVALAAFHAPPLLAYAQLPARMDSLLAGGLLALGLRGPARKQWLNPARLRWILAAGCVALVIAIFASRSVSFASPSMSTVGLTVNAVMSACVLALALIPGTLSNRIGSNRILRFYGRYSYGLYVWHHLPRPWLATWVVPGTQYIHSAILAESFRLLTMLAFFTLVSVLSYHLVEARFLRLKSRFVLQRGVLVKI